jgi:hypothetical protein
MTYVVMGLDRYPTTSVVEAMGTEGLEVLDTTLARAALVRGPAAAIRRIQTQYPMLTIEPERFL